MGTKALSWPNLASLRVRLSVWYMAFMLAGMACYGALLTQYLNHELRSSREATMRRRADRLHAYLLSEIRDRPGVSLQQHMSHFMEASPETDTIVILDDLGRRLFPSKDPGLPTPRAGVLCDRPCLDVVSIHSHPVRVLTVRTTLGGPPLWIIMGGSIDEHEHVLQTVRTGCFVLLPIVLLGSAAGGYALSRRALLPVGRITEKARGLSATALDGRLPVPQTGDELQALAEAWNDLLVRLEAEVNRSTQFTMDASHDLRTAITVILANSQLALRRSRSAEEYCEVLNTILQEATHMLRLLEDMLLAAGAGGELKQLAREPVRFNELVGDVYEASLATAVMNNLTLTFLDDEETWVRGDSVFLRRMISTLVDNALKYTPAGGQIILSLKRNSNETTFSVRDTGVGIAPELQDRIFDRMFRADTARGRGCATGNGLGLSIAKWIAEAHSLRISVASRPGQGSTFTVSMPTCVPMQSLPLKKSLRRNHATAAPEPNGA